ncbi:octopine transport system permease protein OccM [mine drainage metagenome]|uniref:Octopine transport system permease protein OccM n=1 Tax=mine drainage metagenome TaxID=410659 RepID=A0A1J5RWQ0_9ZZZZ
MSFDSGVIVDTFPKLLTGAVLTVQLVALSGLGGLALAFPIGIARSSRRPWVRALPWCYIFFFRGTPLLVQLFLVYYGLSQFSSIRHSELLWPYLRDPYWCALIAMSMNTAAYIAEILRGALQAVPRGEIEAAIAVGMSKTQILRRILVPRAVRIGLPAYSNEVILMLKGSALASTITLLELTGMARTIIAETYMPVEIFLAAGACYLAISFLMVRTFKLVENILNRHLRHAR